MADTPKPATILIVDDEVRNCRLLEALLLPEGYITRTASSGAEALESIAEQAPDLVLLDVMMPGMSGNEVAAQLKANPETAGIPLVMVTAQTDRAARIASLDAGAEDFLTKPVDRAELWLRVRNLLRLKSLAAFYQDHNRILEREVKLRTADLHYLAYYDGLTGLANRSLLIERLTQELQARGTVDSGPALMLLDLERFRDFNNGLGREAGDALLKQVAQWLVEKFGDAVRVARVGPDQFAVMPPDCATPGERRQVLEGAMQRLVDHPFRLNGAVFRISAKSGVAVFPEGGEHADILFRNAEVALRRAKAGGQRLLFYAHDMSAAVAGKLTLAAQLRQALEREEFVLHYQPRVNLANGKVCGAEALIRWNDAGTGLVPPETFLPVLEETGLINDVGRWALRKAIEDYLRWQEAGLAPVRVAVKVSPMQLRESGFVTELARAIAIDPRAAAGLEIGVSESAIMQDVKHSIATLEEVRTLGIAVAIDQFGSGFSSLSNLSRLPVNTLKIASSFALDLTSGPHGLALMSTFIRFGHSLGFKMLADGVSTEDQSRLLRLLNCDQIQGALPGEGIDRAAFENECLAA